MWAAVSPNLSVAADSDNQEEGGVTAL